MKITIIGLRYGQSHHVARACKSIADSTFIDATTAEISFPASDAVILMTEFIQHRWTQVADYVVIEFTCTRGRHQPARIKDIEGNHAVEKRQR